MRLRDVLVAIGVVVLALCIAQSVIERIDQLDARDEMRFAIIRAQFDVQRRAMERAIRCR